MLLSMTVVTKGEGHGERTAAKCNESLGEVVVSKDINLDIHEGEFVVLSDRLAAVNRLYCA